MTAICIKTCCPKNEVTNNITPHVITYVPTAPSQDESNARSVQSLVEHRLVKLKRKN